MFLILTEKEVAGLLSAPSNNNPEGPNFDIDVVTHEMGHQLGGNYTFSHKIEGRGTNIEPGSGSTIMGYTGVVSPTTLNVQEHSDDYYSVNTVQQIQSILAYKTCSITTTINNSPPILGHLNSEISVVVTRAH